MYRIVEHLNSSKCIILIFVLCLDVIVVSGVDENIEEKTSTLRPVNIFIINDKSNEVANKSLTNALQTLREQRTNYLGEIYIVQVNESDPSNALDDICHAWDLTIRDRGGTPPDFLLDVTTGGLAAEIVNSFTVSLGIPTLSAQYGQEGDLRYWRNLNMEKNNYLIQVMPPADIVPQAIRQLAIDLVVSNAAVLFDDGFLMYHKYKSIFLNVPTRHVMNPIKQDLQTTKKQLSRLRDQDIVNFFILGDEKTLKVALDAAQALNFTGRKYGWFALTMDDFEPHCDCRNISVLFMKPQANDRIKQNIAKLQSKLIRPVISSAFYYDLTVLGVETVKAGLQNGDWPDEVVHISCDLYNGNNTPTRNIDFLAQLKATSKKILPTYADFKWGKKNGQHRAAFDMSVELVNIVDGNVVSTTKVGNWSAGIDTPLKISRDVNHTAVTSYRVVTVIHPPFVMYDEKTNKWSGYCIDLLEEIRQYVQFEYDIREVNDKSYGSMAEDGSWNGMIRELVDKRADIGLGSLWVMAERENVIDFTVPYYDLVGLTILMLKPKAPTSLFKFLTVLENEVWFCILAAYFFTSGLMWAFDRWSPYSYQNNREKYKDDDEKREFNFRECLWFCMTSLTPQGGGEAPKNLSGRLIAATWWLFGFIIIASYTANLAAFLTVSRLDTPIESLDDLSKQYKIQYAPAINSSGHTYFKRMADIETKFYEIWKDMSLNDSLTDFERSKLAVWDYPVSDKYTKMFQAMKEAGFPPSVEDAVDRVRRLNSSNEFAFIADASTIKYLALTNCDLIQVGDEFSKKPYAIAVQQGSPLKDQFNDAILVLLNKRKLEKMKDKWWKKNPLKKQCDREDDQSDGISIHNIGGVFIVIFVGIALACVTLAFEYWWFRYRPQVRTFHSNSSPKVNVAKTVKPVRFTLQPAPTHGIPAYHFRSRF